MDANLFSHSLAASDASLHLVMTLVVGLVRCADRTPQRGVPTLFFFPG